MVTVESGEDLPHWWCVDCERPFTGLINACPFCGMPGERVNTDVPRTDDDAV